VNFGHNLEIAEDNRRATVFHPPLSRRSSRLAHSPKCHYFSLQRASVFVPVVAQPIGYVGDIDYAYDSGNVFATSVARSNRVTNKALDKIPPGPKLVNMTISFSKLVLLHPPLTSHKYQALFS
jgi:hypothetical protein